MKNLGKVFSKNKLLIIPAVLGLLIVPSVVVARNNNRNESRNSQESESLEESSSSSSDFSSEDEAKDASRASENESESEDSSDDSASGATQGSVSEAQARTVAQEYFPSKTIEKVETENEEGVLVYSVRFTDSSRVDVSSADGSIVRAEQEEDHSDEDRKPEREVDDDSDDSNDN